MNDFSGASSIAITQSMLAPMPRMLSDAVHLGILYNPFEPHSVEMHELEYRPGATLADYLIDLPSDCEWMIFVNNREVELSDAAEIQISQGDGIGLILVPQGKAIKSLLKIAATIAGAVIGYLIGGPIGAMIGMALVNVAWTLLTLPKAPKSQDDDGQSYGIDGAKNTAQENIVYPVVYGEFRCAGNIVDAYTENVGDDQYLYMRTVLNDGEVEDISDIEINEQPIANFKNVEYKIKKGLLNQDLDPWFNRTNVQVNKGVKLSPTWTSHVTQDEVDMIRFDLVFPSGLVNIDKKKGTHNTQSVNFEFRYRKLDPVTKQPITSWNALPHNNASVEDFSTIYTGWSIQRVRGTAYVTAEDYYAPEPTAVQYRTVGLTNWTNIYEPSFEDYNTGLVYNENYSVGSGQVLPILSAPIDIELVPGDYEFQTTGGLKLSDVSVYPQSGNGVWAYSDSRTRAIRRSFETERLDRGFYEVSVRRVTAESTDDYIIDEVHLADISEITLDNVRMPGTATLSLKIKVDDQLNSIPNVTAKVKGSKVDVFDSEGNLVQKAWSDNPAWIQADIIHGIARGAGMSLTRSDWVRVKEFADWCEAEGLKFNGVFDKETTIGDAHRQVVRTGFAIPIPFGTKMSLAIDKPRNPTAAFTSANIIEGSFKINYLSVADRANEYDVTYYDKFDRNKQKTIRYVDPKAVTFNESPRKASLSLVGVDNVTQAKKELWRAVYSNRLVIRSLTFEAFLDAINLSIGDVALIQHSMMDWAKDGRTKTSTASAIQLDQKVELEAGQHSILVHFSALEMFRRNVASVVGTKILIPTSTLSDPANASNLDRLTLTSNQGIDYEIVKIEKGASMDTITLSEAPVGISAGSEVSFWWTDALVERTVSGVTQNSDGTSTVNVSTPFPEAPAIFSNFIFGKVVDVRRPYVLNGISGDGLEKRTLSFTEYHEGVYGPQEVEIQTPVAQTSDTVVKHVQNLLFDYPQYVESGRTQVNVRVTWNAGAILNYAGADVFMTVNGGELRRAGSAVNSTELTVALSPGDQVRFKVVAYNTRGHRAPSVNAPMVSGKINAIFSDLDPPTGFMMESYKFEADGVALMKWNAPTDTTGIQSYEVRFKKVGDPSWITLPRVVGTKIEIPGLTAGNYMAEVKSCSSTSSSTWTATTFAISVPSGSLLDYRPAEPQATAGAVVGVNIRNDLGGVIPADELLNSLNPSLNYVGFFTSPPTQAQLGAAWKQNAVYKNTANGKSYVLTGSPLAWQVYLEDGQLFQLTIESTNGTTFRVGMGTNTVLKARLFKNGAEITDVTPESWFRWRRVSAIQSLPPGDDATWNTLYSSGYKQISVSVDDVASRATFFCDILSNS